MKKCKELRSYFASPKVQLEISLISKGKLDRPSDETISKLNELKAKCFSTKVRRRGVLVFLPSNWLKSYPALLLKEEEEVISTKGAREEATVCPHCGKTLEYVTYNDSDEAVCPYCGTVIDDAPKFVSVPDELRPIIPGFEPTSPQIAKYLERDVPSHPLTTMVRAFVKELLSLRELMRPDVASHLDMDSGAFDEMVYHLARESEKRFWELMRVVVPPGLVPLCEGCPPTITPCVRMMVALIETVFTERVWNTKESALLALEGAYAACVGTYALRSMVPVLGIGIRSRVGNEDVQYLSGSRLISPSKDVEINKCVAFTQALILFEEARILPIDKVAVLGKQILPLVREMKPRDIRSALARLGSRRNTASTSKGRGSCEGYVKELLATINIRRLIPVSLCSSREKTR